MRICHTLAFVELHGAIVNWVVVGNWKCLSQLLGPWAWVLSVTDMDSHVERWPSIKSLRPADRVRCVRLTVLCCSSGCIPFDSNSKLQYYKGNRVYRDRREGIFYRVFSTARAQIYALLAIS
jgi:hypothetical protein